MHVCCRRLPQCAGQYAALNVKSAHGCQLTCKACSAGLLTSLFQAVPAGASIGVLAKIESADSVMHLEEILDAVDGAMVARGDLGAELPVEQVRLLFASVLHGSPLYCNGMSLWPGCCTQRCFLTLSCLCCTPTASHGTPFVLPWHRLQASRCVLVQASIMKVLYARWGFFNQGASKRSRLEAEQVSHALQLPAYVMSAQLSCTWPRWFALTRSQEKAYLHKRPLVPCHRQCAQHCLFCGLRGSTTSSQHAPRGARSMLRRLCSASLFATALDPAC